MCHLPGPERTLAQMRPGGRTHCHGTLCPISTQEDIGDLYLDVYQLRRLPRRGQCEEAAEKCLCKDILNSLKEHLWLKWPSTQLEGECRQAPVNVTQPDPCLEFVAANCHMYEEFTAVKQDLCEGMLALVRDTH